MKPSFNLCFLIPVYNHEKPLPNLVKQLEAYHIPCILVDDGSEPACASIIQAQAGQYSWVRSIRLAKNQGKGAAVKAGIRLAQELGHTHALQIDADGQHDLHDVSKFIDAARANSEAVIIGQPLFDESVPKLRFYARYLTHVWVYINTLSFRIPDSMCGYKLFPVDSCVKLIDSVYIDSRMAFDTEILVRLDWLGIPVISIPTRVVYPKDGISHFRGFEDNLRISLTHTRLFFGMLSRLPKLLVRHLR